MMSRPFWLLLDTTRVRSRVVVGRGDTVVQNYVWEFDPRYGPHVLAVVEQVLGQAGVSLSQIDRIAVVRGPGHFSLVRSGVGTAMMLAEALEVELVGVVPADLAVQIEEMHHATSVTTVVPQYDS